MLDGVVCRKLAERAGATTMLLTPKWNNDRGWNAYSAGDGLLPRVYPARLNRLLRPVVWLAVGHRAELFLQEIELVLNHF